MARTTATQDGPSPAVARTNAEDVASESSNWLCVIDSEPIFADSLEELIANLEVRGIPINNREIAVYEHRGTLGVDPAIR